MFGLTPWKKRSSAGDVGMWRDRPGNLHPLAELQHEFNALMDRFWRDDFGLSLNGGLEDKDNEFLFHAEIPGFEPDEIDVNLSGNLLSVSAEHKHQEKGDKSESYSYGSFRRTFTLPQGVDREKIDAKYHSGVLEIHLPKTADAKSKRIPVNPN